MLENKWRAAFDEASSSIIEPSIANWRVTNEFTAGAGGKGPRGLTEPEP
jgi:hypothetical protein